MGHHVIDARSATPDQIRRAGLEVLARELGVVGMLRFMQQYEPGQGDYTQERRQILGTPSVDELFDEMEAIEREEAKQVRQAAGKSKRGRRR